MTTIDMQPSNGLAANIAIETSGFSGQLLQELEQFTMDCERRYKYNSRWDNAVNLAGIVLSVSIVAAGVYKQSEWAAILGGLVAALVTTQRAFPFGQRAGFYRNLVGQTQNLLLDAKAGLLSNDKVVAALKSLRLDFAQQFPRGSSFHADGPGGA
jgi:hypothetical protein